MDAVISVTPSRIPLIEHVWDCLDREGYASLGDTQLRLDPGFREHILETYYTGDLLRADIHDVLDRERVRDVVRYEWNGEDLRLTENDTVIVTDDEGHELNRRYERVEVLRDAQMADWIGLVLSLVPPPDRDVRGSFSLNLLRTHTRVVDAPHQDGKAFVMIYVLDRSGGGAETSLYGVDSDEVYFRKTLQPGELIFLRDGLFRHGTTPLLGSPGAATYRNALVCTVNFSSEYPLCESSVYSS